MRIRRLDEHLIRRIAAGEVVERPASVVKELVENSLDAGARTVEVELRGGGMGFISVADDGEGMTPEEMRLAVERHTTSKIRTEEDLVAISTLGFRGEALAAICAVAKVRIVSRPRGGDEAHELRLEGGRVSVDRPAARPPGTTVEVEDLFFNTPARRKFLKSPRAEARYALGVLRRIALAHPTVGFEVLSEGREAFSLPPAGEPLRRIAQIYGGNFAKRLIPVEIEEPGYRLLAFFAPPELHRPTRADQFLFLSGRPVQLGTLGGVLEEVYSRYLPRGGHPVFFLYLEVDPFLVDVNVHPQKHEVRFRNEAAVRDLLRRAARAALGRTAAPLLPSRPIPPESPEEPLPGPRGEAWEVRDALLLPPGRMARPWRVLGQVHGRYIVVETEAGLEIVDQHVAHERVLFEKFQDDEEVPSHLLLTPVPIEFPADVAAALREELPRLRRLGVLLEPFGKQGFLLRGWPAPLVEGRARGDFRAPLEAAAIRALQGGEIPLLELWRELACAGAIKAGEPLSPPEQEALIAAWKATREPARCPHGRPVVLRVTWEELARRLGRD
ncbi:DNA mismatch repair endonuclease MutL [Candidatus Bipolaricaulota sp. J31]